MSSKQRHWLDNATRYGGSFVSTFAKACYCADSDNFRLLLPVLTTLMLKYPNYLDGYTTENIETIKAPEAS